MGVVSVPGVSDMATTNPELAAQWHPTRNGDLTPADVKAGTNRKVWWRCDEGHEWQAIGANRLKGRGCPVCAGQSVLAGYNDLATTNPELAVQWHPTRNGDLTPADVMAGTNRKVWWRCSAGHSWSANIHSRQEGTGCPVCSGRTALAGYNDLATTNPELAAQWHPTKNGDLTPSDVVAGTAKSIWWSCDEGHEWQARGASRRRGSGCPVCAGQLVAAGKNDLATTNPELAAQWHPTKNGDLTPRDVVAGSGKRYWWRCDQGHEWEAPGDRRTGGSKCPVCSGRTALVGYNDLATTNPELAAQWHPTRNGGLTPQDVTAGSHRKVWWLCDQGHEWDAVLKSRELGNGCPVCSGRTALAGYNDLATTNPELAAQWHPTKNGDLTPSRVVSGSGSKAWWVCPEGHEWPSAISSRSSGRGCPTCAKHGFDPGKPATLYFIANSRLSARKVGITNVGTSRLAAFAKTGWQQLLVVERADGSLVRDVESAMLAWLRKDLGLPQHLGPEDMGREGGWTETFSEDGPSDSQIIDRIKAEFDRLEAKSRT